MKNIHLILVNKVAASLYHCSNTRDLFTTRQTSSDLLYEVYITSDEEIKEGDSGWLFEDAYIKSVCEFNCTKGRNGIRITDKKIILTTDQSLIKDGVQAIDDEFLQWFVKNPLCKEVEVELFPKFSNKLYGIIIPKEEPNETLEEVAESKYGTDMDSIRGGPVYDLNADSKRAFVKGAKWQTEQNNTSKVNRVEVIQHSPPYNGRAYTNYNAKNVEIQFQDDNTTLKIFLK